MKLFNLFKKPDDSEPNPKPPVSLATISSSNDVPKEEKIEPLQINFDNTVREKDYHSFINKLGITPEMLKNDNLGGLEGLNIDVRTKNLVVPRELLAEQGNLFLNYVIHPENHPDEKDLSPEVMKKLLFDAASKVEVGYRNPLNKIIEQVHSNLERTEISDMPKGVADSVHKILNDIKPEQLPIFQGPINNRVLDIYFSRFKNDSNGISKHIMDISEKIEDESKLNRQQYNNESVMNTLIKNFFDKNSDKNLMLQTMNRLVDNYPPADVFENGFLFDVIKNVANPNNVDRISSQEFMSFTDKIFDKAPQNIISGQMVEYDYGSDGESNSRSYRTKMLLSEALSHKYSDKNQNKHNTVLDKIITKLLDRSTIQDLEWNKTNAYRDDWREFLGKEIEKKRLQIDPVAQQEAINVANNLYPNGAAEKPSEKIGMNFSQDRLGQLYKQQPVEYPIPDNKDDLAAKYIKDSHSSSTQQK